MFMQWYKKHTHTHLHTHTHTHTHTLSECCSNENHCQIIHHVASCPQLRHLTVHGDGSGANGGAENDGHEKD